MRRFIGDRAFYRRVMAVALPLIVQNAITNFVSLLDNIMVGQVGTLQMNGVSIVNNLLFVFNLCIFGAVSGAGIFTAQYHGSGNVEKVRDTFRFKVLTCLAMTAAGLLIFGFGGGALIDLYLQGEGLAADIEATRQYGLDYLAVMMVGLLPFALANSYSSTLRETGHGTVPMLAGIAAVLVNLCLNYVLIFGKFGAPALGVMGAAWATVIARVVEFAIVGVWTHVHADKAEFIRGAYRSFRIPVELLKAIVRKGLPLLMNEAVWSVGVAVLNQCYSTRGLDVVAALNISSAITNMTSVVYLSIGNSVGILMGQMLGAGCTAQEAKDANRKMFALGVGSCFIFGTLLVSLSGVFPQLYVTTPEVRRLATVLICITASIMPFNAYSHASYFTLRAGGQTGGTFLFDRVYIWVGCVSVALSVSRVRTIAIIPMYWSIHIADYLKPLLGYFMLRKGTWIRNLTE